jgi:gamma-glutamyltranspeptidase/glutathione hydrolase
MPSFKVLPWQAVVNPSVHIARYGFRGELISQAATGNSVLTWITVAEDLVRYMDSAMSPSNKFLVDDPDWAIDFAPNGKWS